MRLFHVHIGLDFDTPLTIHGKCNVIPMSASNKAGTKPVCVAFVYTNESAYCSATLRRSFAHVGRHSVRGSLHHENSVFGWVRGAPTVRGVLDFRNHVALVNTYGVRASTEQRGVAYAWKVAKPTAVTIFDAINALALLHAAATSWQKRAQ